jgi:hypothetical protein
MISNVHNRSRTTPFPLIHPDIERTDDNSAVIQATSPKSGEADSTFAKAKFSLVVPSLIKNKAITDIYMVDMSGNLI